MEMVAFFLLVILGTFVQTITGFAMGLIVMGGVALLGLLDFATAAAVISLVSMANVVVALRRQYRHIHRPLLIGIIVGMLPMIFVGVSLLSYLSGENVLLLKVLLGLVIVVAGLMLIRKPQPYEQVSKRPFASLAGIAAGLMGGLYGAGGAPTAYLMYRQPLLPQAIRATLLSTFAISTVFRTGFVAIEGHLTTEVFYLVGLSIPLVIIVTEVGNRVAPKLPDAQIRQAAFWLLILIGLSLAGGGLAEIFF